MKEIGGRLLVLSGALALGFGGFVGLRGAEAPIPSGADAIEGLVAAGETVVSPVGEPFQYGLVRIDDARSASQQSRSAYWAEAVGAPRIRVETSQGVEETRLEHPSEWYRAETTPESREVSSLSGLPVVGAVDIGDRLQPPFRIRVEALREGDALIVDRRGHVYLGDRASLDVEHARREELRWPVVGMLAFLGLISIFAGVSLLRSSRAGGATAI